MANGFRGEDKLYGNFIFPVGSKTQGGLEIRDDENKIEPVCFHTLPHKLYEELLHRYFIANVIDLTPGSFIFGEVCMQGMS